MDEESVFGSTPIPRPPEVSAPRPPDPVAVQSTRRPPRAGGGNLCNLLRFVYCHNPFYCVSAFLVLWGLGKSFHFQGGQPQPELLMAGLAGYALLLAAVAWLLIRAGQLWEDIRTILLLIVLIFLAISMSFDEVLSADLNVGRIYFLGGLAFAVVLSESVLRGVRLRLPVLFRLPYYALLALFFLYPLFLGPWQDQENDPHIRWLLAAFSPLAGLATLTLLPAVRRGANYVRDNGSPWQWPWYPWPLFVFLGLGVGVRTYALCVSFHPSRGPATMFEPYFLVPWLFAVNVVLLEIGIVSRRPGLLRWMMAMPLALLALSTWTFAVPEPINLRQMLLAACGCSPFFLTILGATALYAIALLRRVAHAFHWLTVAVALLVMVGPTTGSFHGPLCLHAWPLALLAAIQFFAAIRYRSGLNALLTAVCAIAALCIAWPDAIWARWFGAIPAHLFLFAMLLIGALIRDRVSRFLQGVAIAEVLIACGFVLSGEADRWSIAPSAVLMLYPGFLFVLAAAYSLCVPWRWYRAIPLGILIAWMTVLCETAYGHLHPKVAGLDEIALGLACLLFGLTMSLWKIGLPQVWWQRFIRQPPVAVVPSRK